MSDNKVKLDTFALDKRNMLLMPEKNWTLESCIQGALEEYRQDEILVEEGDKEALEKLIYAAGFRREKFNKELDELHEYLELLESVEYIDGLRSQGIPIAMIKQVYEEDEVRVAVSVWVIVGTVAAVISAVCALISTVGKKKTTECTTKSKTTTTWKNKKTGATKKTTKTTTKKKKKVRYDP